MTYISTVIADGAVGLWPLGETSPGNGTTATDQKANQNGAYALTNWTNVAGIPGGAGATAVALTSSNTGNKVTIADVAAQRATDGGMTMECWVKRSATQSATQRIWGAANSGGAQLGWNASNQLQVGKIATANIVASTNAITDTTTWHHLVWTKATTTNKLYIDGVDVTGSVSNQSLTTAAGWWIFEDSSSNNAPPSGMAIAMVAIYTTVLSAGTIATHYSLGAAAAPVNTVAPAVTGTTTVGQTLSCTTGTWTTSNPVYTYQWQRDVAGNGVFSNIASATSSTYPLVDLDDGNKILCNVKDTDDNGNTTQASNQVGLVIEPDPTNSVVPALGGTNATVGQIITSTTGTWANMGGSNPTFTYQWKDSATAGGAYSNVVGATSSSYTVGAGEVGLFLKCFVTAHNTGSPATANSVASAQVAASAASDTAQPSNTAAQFLVLFSGAAN